ncbi:MAG TPA: iron uptake transporter permease EfeU [Candidatus Limnocylindria bacterium]|jgi:high-affinity iron transporter
MLATFVIGLREGLEAALIVGIVAAFLRQSGRSDALRLVWIGVAGTVAFCIGVAVLLQIWHGSLPHAQQEALEAVIGLVAVGMVTYMILWMRSHARGLRRDIEDATSTALARGSALALVAAAVLAVLREGLETAVFLLAAFQASEQPLLAGLGAALGVVVAVGLGYAIYRGGVRLDLGRFFRLTGVVLVFVAAGLVASSLHAAHEAGWLTIGQQPALDLAWLVQPGTLWSSLLTGVLGIPPQPTVIELVGYLAYLVPMLLVVLWPVRPARTIQAAATLALMLALLGCSASAGEPGASAGSDSTVVSVTLTEAGCAPDPDTVPAGTVEFDVASEGGDGVDEVELMQGETVLAEAENLAPGLSGGFSLELEPGTYTVFCPGADTPESPLEVE